MISILNLKMIESVQVENETVATAGQLTPIMDGRHMHKDVFQVEVTCRHIGETEVTYRVGNIPATANVYPMRSSTQIKVCWSREKRLPIDIFFADRWFVFIRQGSIWPPRSATRTGAKLRVLWIRRRSE